MHPPVPGVLLDQNPEPAPALSLGLVIREQDEGDSAPIWGGKRDVVELVELLGLAILSTPGKVLEKEGKTEGKSGVPLGELLGARIWTGLEDESRCPCRSARKDIWFTVLVGSGMRNWDIYSGSSTMSPIFTQREGRFAYATTCSQRWRESYRSTATTTANSCNMKPKIEFIAAIFPTRQYLLVAALRATSTPKKT